MSPEPDETTDAVEATEVEEEVLDGLPVLAGDPRVLEASAPSPAVPARQAAALAATGFVAGAATVALVHRHKVKVASRRPRRGKKRTALGDIVTSNSFLVDVHLLRRD